MRAQLSLAALLAALTVLGGCRIHTRPSAPRELPIAPDFTLEAHTGVQVSLSDVLDRGVGVVVFYRGYW